MTKNVSSVPSISTSMVKILFHARKLDTRYICMYINNK